MPTAQTAKYDGELLTVIATCARMTGSFVRPSSLRDSGGLPLDVSSPGLQSRHLSATSHSWTPEDISNIDAMLQYYGLFEESECSMANIATEGYFRRVTTPGPADESGVDMFVLLVKTYAERGDTIHTSDILVQLADLSMLRAFEVLRDLETGSECKIPSDALSDVRNVLVAHCQGRQASALSGSRPEGQHAFSSLSSTLINKPFVVSNIFFQTAEAVASRVS